MVKPLKIFHSETHQQSPKHISFHLQAPIKTLFFPIVEINTRFCQSLLIQSMTNVKLNSRPLKDSKEGAQGCDLPSQLSKSQSNQALGDPT